VSNIDNFVQVTITKETATVSRVGFGTPATLTYHTVFPERARVYGSLQEMIDDGFTTSSREYKMANAAFSQNPRVQQIVIGRRDNAPLRDVKLTPVSPVLASTVYDIEINGEVMDYTSDSSPTAAEITAGITTSVNGGSQNVLATDNLTDVDIESADSPGGTSTAGVPFVISFDPDLWTFDDATADPGLAADITAMRTANDDWYGLASDALGGAEISVIAAAIEAIPKIYAADTQDSDVLGSGSTDIMSTLQTAAYDRTFPMYHPNAGNDGDQPGIAWLGEELPRDPGSSTWKFKTLKGVATYELTTSEQSNLEGKNGNHYQTTAGFNVTSEGKMSGGEWIDVTVFLDWLTARIKEAAFAAFAANPKIPYTDLGIQTLGSTTKEVLEEGARRGGLDPAGEVPLAVDLPRAADASSADKQARELTYDFAGTLSGAIHKAFIRGRVTV
jgi:hypothetical protein